MHPRLRRQLAAVRSDLPPEFRQLIAAVDAAYREDDAERAELEQSVTSLTALLHRAQKRAGLSGEQRKERHSKALRAQKRLGRLLEKSRLAVFELTPDLVVKKANPAAAKLMAAKPQELAGKKLFEMLEPLGAADLPEKWARKLARGEPVARTLACNARDGRPIACDWVLFPRIRADGSVFRVTAVLRDQTEVVEKH